MRRRQWRKHEEIHGEKNTPEHQDIWPTQTCGNRGRSVLSGKIRNARARNPGVLRNCTAAPRPSVLRYIIENPNVWQTQRGFCA